MKKLVYTLSFITVLSLAGNAQSKETAKPTEPAKAQEPAKKAVKPTDVQTVPAAPTSNEPKSRMAITQKGLPASKAKEKENKDAKATEPKGQPTATEKH